MARNVQFEELQEHLALINDLSIEFHTDLSFHLYSAYLQRLNNNFLVPAPSYTAWPAPLDQVPIPGEAFVDEPVKRNDDWESEDPWVPHKRTLRIKKNSEMRRQRKHKPDKELIQQLSFIHETEGLLVNSEPRNSENEDGNFLQLLSSTLNNEEEEEDDEEDGNTDSETSSEIDSVEIPDHLLATQTLDQNSSQELEFLPPPKKLLKSELNVVLQKLINSQIHNFSTEVQPRVEPPIYLPENIHSKLLNRIDSVFQQLSFRSKPKSEIMDWTDILAQANSFGFDSEAHKDRIFKRCHELFVKEPQEKYLNLGKYQMKSFTNLAKARGKEIINVKNQKLEFAKDLTRSKITLKLASKIYKPLRSRKIFDESYLKLQTVEKAYKLKHL